MQKTKLGISAGLAGAAIYFLGLFGGLLLIALFAMYVLLVEDNEWLRRTSVKAVVIFVIFSLLSTLLSLIPDTVAFVSSFFEIFGGYFSIPFISSIIIFIDNGLSLIKTVLFIILGLKALNQGTIVIPFIDTFINKYIR